MSAIATVTATPRSAYETSTCTAYLGVHLFAHNDPLGTYVKPLFMIGNDHRWIYCQNGLADVSRENRQAYDECVHYAEDQSELYGLIVDVNGDVLYRALSMQSIVRCTYLGHWNSTRLATRPLNIADVRCLPPLPKVFI